MEEALLSAFRQMWPLFARIAVAMVVTTVLPMRRQARARLAITFLDVRQPPAFTPTDLQCLYALPNAAPHLDIHGKVRLEDVIGVRPGLPRNEHHAARNRIKSRHLDFVLVDVTTTRVVCAFELDDPSHNTPRVRQLDEFKDRVMKAAGIPLLRVRAAPSYRTDELARMVLDSTQSPDPQMRMPVSKPSPYEMNDFN